MARRVGWKAGYRLALTLTDAVVVAASLGFAQSVRFDMGPLVILRDAHLYTLIGFAIGILWLGCLSIRSREVRYLGQGSVEYQRVATATFVTFGAIAVLALLLKLDLARGYLLVALPVGLVALLAERLAWRSWLNLRRREGLCLIDAFVIGNHQDATRVTNQLVTHHHAGYRPVGVAYTDSGESAPETGMGDLNLPTLQVDELPDIARATRTRAVIVAGELPGGRDQIQDLGWQLENSKTELILVTRLTDVAGPRITLRPVEGLPMVHVDLPQYTGLNHTIKRGIDLALGGLALLLVSPILAAVAIAIRVGSPGPIFFRQERVGIAGSSFTMFKFRSMVIGAEEQLDELATTNEGAGLLFKMKDDPRITRVGRAIRRYSLDELPQLLNVLNGTMSLIGPRPPLPREVAAYEGRVNRRLLIKPGITGLWQISGRSNLSWEESIKLDLYYVENWSLTTDFIILAKTVRAVLQRDGAY
ncbi:sugar transferase [uncultured Amnibacterium sp.]|uniref:sugar transferase n=1 Tax=uncultured Amnibacterium sp. TaxID=1631851 RepID=UPI0035CA609E